MNKTVDTGDVLAARQEVTVETTASAEGLAVLQSSVEAARPASLRGRLRRALICGLSQLLPGLTARLLARHYLSSPTFIDRDRLAARGGVRIIALANGAVVLRHSASGAEPPQSRVLIVHGHDGHVRQFARMIRSLCRDGFEVDALILPGHVTRERTPCTLADGVRSLRDAVAQEGPYEAILAHCVSANALLFALGEGVTAPKIIFVSAPLELAKLIRLGGLQSGLSGRCLDRFIAEVSRLGAPYAVDRPWRPVAAQRPERLLAIHVETDYAAPLADVRELVRLWPDARLSVIAVGDHNAVVQTRELIDMVRGFLSAEKD